MKNKLVFLLLIASLLLNIYFFGKWFLFNQWFEATTEESIILSEMILKTVESEDYLALREREKIIAIEPDINKFNGGVFPFYMEVSVRTEQQTYLFSCSNKQCSSMKNEGWSYSFYEEEKPRLPFQNTD
ncbi:hypothetical protein H9655_10975 [Cytobacillus sp. Sa5YUA1]|uniref:Lipoprotein n=1 Tax=Cytobacillus stercorigallinarum TaxID=2762240 RepID=A0ABR8QPS3_9BACI|nr:hypothetical protein [Cytobacillus stercorigallinarum]MBD7937546.1 hypothetical protein [Cytobacillus stercorigallinarum]